MAAALAPILESKHREVALLAGVRANLRAGALDLPPARGFASALRQPGEVAVIAEIKRRSPSAGWIREGANAAALAMGYEKAGAAAVSVLTDRDHFGGALADLSAVRHAVALPLLRKDFVIDEVQLYEARVAGADAALLIARILDGSRLDDLLGAAAEVGLDVLVETHDELELERALAAGAGVIGINNRDLDTLRVDRALALRLGALVPADRIAVAESGIADRAHVDALGDAGIDAILVGERLMRAADPAAALDALVARRKTTGR